MIENATLILGPPGCGKTHYLIQQVEEALAAGVRPHQIVFVSFTRKAIQEAVARACGASGLQQKDFPFFKTLHALGYAGLGLQRTDILGAEDYVILGRELGLIIETRGAINFDDGQLIPEVAGSGSAYLSLENRARYRGVSLAEEFNDANNYDIYYPLLEKFREVLNLYKQNTSKFDFVDMIEKYVDMVDAPYSRLLIVDEAQDLTWLQWQMVKKLAENSERVLIAGDDDQAIYSFAGAEVSNFINAAANKMVLEQSYRLPRAVWELSQRHVQRIRGRIPKQFHPRDEEGSVFWHPTFDTIPFDNGESWTIMCRVNAFAKEISERLEEEGYVYSVKGRPSINQDVATAIYSWRALQAGQSLYLRQVLGLYKMLTKQGQDPALKRGATTLLDAADPEAKYDMQALQKNYGLLAGAEDDAYDVIKIPSRELLYIAAAERRGVDITMPPRINVSTFHAMKGGQDDNCVVYLGSTKACSYNDLDDELRATYVAITRSKKTLHLLETEKKFRIDL